MQKTSFLNFLFIKLLLQNTILGLTLGLFIKQFFSLYQLAHFSYIEGSLIFAFMMGILVSGYLSEHLGRQFLSSLSWAILVLALLFLSMIHLALLIWIALAFSFFALGVFVTVFPVYVAECAPCLSRGSWVLNNFLALLIGVSIFAFIDFNLLFSQFFWCLSTSGLALVALLINHSLLESPAWLIEQARFEEAKVVLLQLRTPEEVDKEMAVSRSSIRRRPGSWQQIYERQFKVKLKVSRYLAIFRQLTGVGVMLFYLPHLFTHRWSIDPGVLWILIFISLSTGLLFSAIYIDSVGRRKLTTFSFFFQGLVLLALAFSWKFNLQHSGIKETLHEVVLLLSFLFFFALGSGPVTWLSWIELMPLRSRIRYIATFLLMTLVLGILIWLSYYFLINWIGMRAFYFIVATLAFVAAAYCWQKMPETKSFLLDEI